MRPPHERYQAKPFVASSHSWALEILGPLRPGRALDVGPGSGVMGVELRRLGWADIAAVETDPATRASLAHTYSAIEPSLSSLPQSKFDLVLLLDVLEHMPEPESFLLELSPFLRPGSLLLVSVPNVAHWSVRLMLLAGFFPQMTRGILDRTHCRFFTRRTFHGLLSCLPGAVISRTSASIEPLELVLPRGLWENGPWRALSKCRQTAARLFPGLLGFQHLALVEIRGR